MGGGVVSFPRADERWVRQHLGVVKKSTTPQIPGRPTLKVHSDYFLII